jgi:hypothetical protein
VEKTRRRRGCLPMLLVLALILGVVAVVADRIAAGVAERRIAEMVRSEAERRNVLPVEVEAQVSGFPFLTQALSGRFDGGQVFLSDLKVRTGNTQVRTVTVQQVDIAVDGLSVPRDVLTGAAPHDIIAETLTGTATVTMDQIAAAVPIQGLKLTGSGKTVRFSAPIPIRGLGLTATGTANVQLRGNRVVLDVQEIKAGEVQVPRQALDQLTSQFQAGAELPPLPLGLKVTGLQMSGGLVVVNATAKNANLAG